MSARDSRSLPASTWPELLQEARTPREVLAIVRDFVATWTPQEIDALPARARLPLRFTEPEDVVNYAFELSQARLAGAEQEPLGRMWRFFMDASLAVGTALSRGKETDAANA